MSAFGDWIVILVFVGIVIVSLSMMFGKGRSGAVVEVYGKKSKGLSVDEFERQLNAYYEEKGIAGNGLERGRGENPDDEYKGAPRL